MSLTISALTYSAQPFDSVRSNAQLKQFLSLFSNRHGSMVRQGTTGNWRTTSQYHALTDAEIEQSLRCDSKLRRAYSFDTTTNFAVIHIPPGSCYFEINELDNIRRALGPIAPHIKLYQCDDQRYLYIFFSTSQSSDAVSEAIYKALSIAGINVSDTTASVYPKLAGCVPFPIQPGFAWLSPIGRIVMHREEVSLEAALAMFLFDVQRNAIEGSFFFDSVDALLRPESATGARLSTSEEFASSEEILPVLDDDRHTFNNRAGTPSEPFVQPRILLSVLKNIVTDCTPDEIKASRAPPRKLRNSVTRRCRSPDSRRSSSGRY